MLLHNTSSTNAAILDELLTRWEAMGYTFGRLEDLQAAADILRGKQVAVRRNGDLLGQVTSIA